MDWIVPDYPGEILALKACIDSNDDVWEERETKKARKISDPDESGTTNNCSRTERFYIAPPDNGSNGEQSGTPTTVPSNNQNAQPSGIIENGDCEKVTGWAKGASGADSIPVEIYIGGLDADQFLEALTANAYRSNLGGNYGIDWSVPPSLHDGRARDIKFYLSGSQRILIGKVTLNCPSPIAPTPTPTVPNPVDDISDNQSAPDFIISRLGLQEGVSIDQNSVVHPYCVIRNDGNAMPSSGIRTAYYIDGEYKADDGSDAAELSPGMEQYEHVLSDGIRVGSTGTRTLKCCADYQGIVSESSEDNNCATATFEVKPAGPDFIISGIGFREGTSIRKGSKVHPFCVIRNQGNATPSSGIRTAYYIDGQYRADDGSDAAELTPGRDQREEVLNDDIQLGNTGNRTLKRLV